MPHIEGSNLIVELDVEDYKHGVEEPRYSVVGRNHLQKGKPAPMTIEMEVKLALIWGLDMFKLIPIGRGFFHIVLKTMEEQRQVLSHGPVNFSPGLLDGS